MGNTGRAAARARVLIVDDHPIVCDGLTELLNRQADLVACGTAHTVAEAQNALAQERPDLVLLDLRLGQADGLETIKSLRKQFAGLRILVMSQLEETVYAERALRAGALGYLMKEQATEELLRAIRMVLHDQMYVSPSVSMMALKRILVEKPTAGAGDASALTDRELQVFTRVGRGKSNKEIAAELNLSVKTIETYREHIKYKLGLSSGAELVARAKHAALDGEAGSQ